MTASAQGWTHVIVGAGAAGCVLAARLSEDPNHRVLLIEAGGTGRFDPMLQVPLMTALLLRGRRHNWQFRSGPEPTLGGREIALPRGRVLGGSTAINGMVYVRGLPLDYDLWAQSGLPDWSAEKVWPYFLRSEDFRGPGPDEGHATGGPVTVSRRETPVSPLARAFVEAGIAAGHPRSSDFNGPDPEGFGFYHFTIRNGRRHSAARAFLDAARDRPNLTIRTRLDAERIAFEAGRAAGVVVRAAGGNEVIRCEGEIILSAGAFGSPAVLMRSGVGPAGDLMRLGIPVVADRAQVGQNLQDHVLVRVSHSTRDDVSLHRLTRIDRAAVAFLQAWIFGSGPMTVFPLEAGAYLRTPGADAPTLQTHFMPALTSATVRFNPFRKPVNQGPGFFANPSVMRPASRGFVRLTGRMASDPLEIRMNYLEDPRDLGILADGVEMMRDVFAQRPFDPYRGAELAPGPDLRSRAQIEDWVRANADTVHHSSGTCRMGTDDAAVVDAELRVNGVEGLRVVDASIFPSVPSTNTAAPTMMVAEKAADLINGPR